MRPQINFGMFYMFGESHIHEGFYVEDFIWEGRYEPKVTAHG